ncbi:carboxypeptidase regulatory-like domain-containing protein [Silvibacterium sp.]|uniref:TonB-dependent receptor n=1 Tax=Silvibacterium sp. TaxID=1964179 RepID=UPI0039E425EC
MPGALFTTGRRKLRNDALLALFVLLLSVLIASPRLHAQAVTATLLGTVTDNSGAAVPSAAIVITEAATGIVHNGVTNESGNYTFPNLPPGTYSISVTAKGFKKEDRENVDVLVNTTTRVDLALQPGSVNETVIVTAAPAIMQTDRADVSMNIESHVVENMPLSVNQNFQSLLTLVPGAGPPIFEHSQFFNASSSIQTEVNGQPRMGNSYQIEGIDDDERTGLLQILIPPQQSIQTVDVSTSNFEAELGRAIGTVANVIIKSGTNQFHGMATEYLQNSVFDARAYFNTSVGHLSYNYFGGGLGGPILKDKLFFYGDYFRSPDHEANSNILTIPPQQWYTPNAAGYIDLSDPLSSSGKGQIYDPATGNADGSGRTPFANNQIPYSRVNPVSIALMKLLPAPNANLATSTTSPTNNFSINLPFQKTTTRYDAKIDYQITQKDHLSGRYNEQDVNIYQAPAFGDAGGGPAQGAFAGTGKQNTYSTGLNYDHAFSGTLLTEARIGVAHYGNSARPSGYGTDYATQIGIPGVNISDFTSGQVGISMGDFSSNPLIGYSASMPWVRTETNIDAVNHWTKIIRNHTVKFGVDVRRIHDDLLQDQTFSPRGVITFSEDNTSEPGATTNVANEMASLLLDVPSQEGRDLNTYFPAYRQWWFFAFGGDKWQVTPKLTADIGVRWELYPPATPKESGGFSNYDPSNNTLVIAGVGNNPSNLGMKTRYSYFAPRVGFAYRATEQTVVRGGFGISYTPFEDNTYAYNYPVRANNSYQQLNSYQPALLSNGSTATFQAGFPAPVAITIPADGILTAPISQSYVVIPKDFYNPYVESWNVAVQQSLPAQFTFTLSYVANHGVHIGAAQNINLPSSPGLGTAGEPEYIAYGRSAATNVYFLGYSSNYQSLQAQLNRRFANSLGVITSFTWGKGLGYQTSDDGGLLFWLDQRHNYAPNDFDHRLNFEESLTYDLPWGPNKRWLNHGVAASVIGGWKLSAIISIYSGLPFDVEANGGTLNTPGQQQMANLVKPFHVTHGIGASRYWFDPTSFSQPAGCPTTGTCQLTYGSVMGNVGRNAYYGPGYIQDNVSLFKTFRLWEELSLETRADAFQLSNTPQFASPSSSLTSTTFGKVTSTVGSGTGINGIGGGRALQLAATLRF